MTSLWMTDMNTHDRLNRILYKKISLLLALSMFLSGCNIFMQTADQTPTATDIETIDNYPQAEIVFQVKVPAPIADGDHLVLEILDDVTGTFFNPFHYQMAEQDEQNFFIRIPLIIGQRIKYRFIRQGTQSFYEYTAQNKQINYRMLYVTGPLLVQDLIAGWSDLAYTGPVGRIRGQLVDQDTNTPLPNLLITAAGMQTLSSSDGSFILEGISTWTHNLVISSLDGAYQTFQQGALIAEESTTPIIIPLMKRKLVQVDFEVKVPDNFSTNLPMRLATNLNSLGFRDADLGAGSSLTSSELPVFTQVSQNTYTLSLNLPAGADFRYKFTFGDGFWNAELDEKGGFVSRLMVVPGENISVKKKIAAMTFQGSSEISFQLLTPSNTPINDKISIQFNPFGWMQPLPMIRTGENEWAYTIYNPIHLLGEVEYRFCRNDQCSKAISEPSQNGRFSTTGSPQILTTTLSKWSNLSEGLAVTNVDTASGLMEPRNGFIAGFEFIKSFPVSWNNNVDQGIKTITNSGANWVIVSPTWSITSINPPLVEPVPGVDLLWPDMTDLLTQLTSNKLQPVLFPQLSSGMLPNHFWTQAKKDDGWWNTLFDRYHRFMLQNADLAMVTGSYGIIIGDPAMKPAMGGGILADGTMSNSPANADEQWIQMIYDIRARYSGPVIGVISVPDQAGSLPGWLSEVDGIYILFSPSLLESSDTSINGIRNAFGMALDSLAQPLAAQYGKPLIIGIDYSSNNHAIQGCVAVNDSCLNNANRDYADLSIDLNSQAVIYNAAIIECSNRPWISGFISRGFDPTVVLHDQRSSVYGKPAMDILWFWYHFILNKPS